jgi:hypothetical protein
MYNLPEMQAVNARFWEALRGLLLEAGLRDLPEGLSYERPPVPDRIGPEVLFSQTCGYPLETIFADQAVRLGTPWLCGAWLRRPDALRALHRARRLDSRGAARSARRHVLVQPSAFEFGDEPAAARPGGYRRRPAAVRKRCRDRQPARQPRSHRPRRGRCDGGRLRDLCVLVPLAARGGVPCPRPRANPAKSGDPVRDIGRDAAADGRDAAGGALRVLATEPRYAAVRHDLLLEDIRDVPAAAYRGLLDYEREAAELGYPELA